MPNIVLILSVIIMALSTGVLAWFFVSTVKALNKFDALDVSVQNKLLLMENYMAFVRQFKKDELIKINELSDDEIIYFNGIHDIKQRIKLLENK